MGQENEERQDVHYYQLEDVRKIARGGMSNIYRAFQPNLGRYVVIKRLRSELKNNQEVVERFRREARALAKVLHQNVAHVYDFVDNGTESYLLMEYIDGLDLSAVIKKVGHLPPEIAAGILLGMAEGTSYIHSRRLIHRDIKPSNVRLTTRGEIKLMDFGIALSTDNQGLTRPGVMVGSPSYLSPEQVLGDTVTPRADIFLLGICFYEMLTGTKPFKDEGNETSFKRIREVKYTPVQKMKPNLPKPLVRIVSTCLKKNPKERYNTVKEMITELEKFLGPVKTARKEDMILKYLDEEALVEPSAPYQDLIPKPVKKKSSLVWVLAFVLFGAFAYLAWDQWIRVSIAPTSVANPVPPPNP